MKKILITLILCLCSLNIYCQDIFTRNYKYMIVKRNDVIKPMESITLTVVFNPNNTKGVKFYYPDGKVTFFYQVTGVKKGTTKGGQEYQIMDVVSSENGDELTIQLFENILRVIFSAGNTIEFYEE